jgi:hypothetical protein
MRVTIEELIAAAEANGYEHIRHAWFRDETGNSTGGYSQQNTIVKACFMGQVALNLGVEADSLLLALNKHFAGLGNNIITWNDFNALPYKDILGKFKNRLKSDKSIPTSISLKSFKYKSRKKGK